MLQMYVYSRCGYDGVGTVCVGAAKDSFPMVSINIYNVCGSVMYIKKCLHHFLTSQINMKTHL